MNRKNEIPAAQYCLSLGTDEHDSTIFGEAEEGEWMSITEAQEALSEMKEEHVSALAEFREEIKEAMREKTEERNKLEAVEDVSEEDLSQAIYDLNQEIESLEMDLYYRELKNNSWEGDNGMTKVLNYSVESIAMISAELEKLEDGEARYREAYEAVLKDGEDAESADDYAHGQLNGDL